MEFSTHDKDNDAWGGENCAALQGNAGNWWRDCGSQNINGLYGKEGDSGFQVMTWATFDKYRSLKTMKLMIRSAV